MRQRRCSNVTNDVILSDNKKIHVINLPFEWNEVFRRQSILKVKASYRHDIESAASAQFLNEAYFVFRVKC